MDHQPRDSGAPPSQQRGRLSSRPGGRASAPSTPGDDRATPVADEAMNYAAYIAASDAAKVHGNTTVRIDAAVLDGLREQTQRTGANNQRPPEMAEALDRAARPPPPAPAPSRIRALPLLGAVAVLASAALWIAFTHRTPATADPPALPKVQASARATAAPTGVAAVPAQPMHTEEQARAALERLREGLGECIRLVHALPGSSPAVPAMLASLKAGGYAAPAAEWRTPVWSCAHFQASEPMQFQIQWQLLKPGVEGMGVAWIDADGDGVADRALGFHITLGPKGAPVLGDIAPVAPAPAVIAGR